ENSTGGGVLNVNCAPTFTYTIISKNIAASYGAGIMDKGGIKKLERCLIEKNITKKSDGAGLYTVKGPLEIEASVFDGNIALDTAGKGGAALYVKGVGINIVNSIFTNNETKRNGGAIYNDSGRIFIENNTFFSNTAGNGQSVWNEKGSVTIINSILWNNAGKQEISGDAAYVNYTCITGGYAGTGNISQNPIFVNTNSPEGNDGLYGTNDDGLQLSGNSPCISAGAESNIEFDIRLMPRPQGDVIDLGAYEYYDFANNSVFFGIINNKGDFVEKYGFPDVLPCIFDVKDIPYFAKSKIGRIMRVKVPKNKYTRNRTNGYLYARWKEEDGRYLEQSSNVRMNMVKVGEDHNTLYFQSVKRVLFVLDERFQNYDNPYTYIIAVSGRGTLELTVPHNQ
ncbi:MAG: hypothetical protein LBI42_00710, partial [Chitinispirillales bacterium]|nr:hypothetical protein [Chitinispirillales bacterium]